MGVSNNSKTYSNNHDHNKSMNSFSNNHNDILNSKVVRIQ